MRPSRIVIDTNVVIAGAIAPRSNPAKAIVFALESAKVLKQLRDGYRGVSCTFVVIPEGNLLFRLYTIGGNALVSPALRVELEAVFRRPKFDRYSDIGNRLEYLAAFYSAATQVSVRHSHSHSFGLPSPTPLNLRFAAPPPNVNP